VDPLGDWRIGASPRERNGGYREIGCTRFFAHPPAADADAENRPVARQPVHPQSTPSQSSNSDGDVLRMRRARRAVDEARSPHVLPPPVAPSPNTRLGTGEW